MTRAKRHLVLALLALAARPVTAWAALQDEEADNLGSQPFALPLARDARTIAERAAGHLAAQRWSEGIADLQRLLEEHGSDVLPARWRASAPAGRASWASTISAIWR